MADRVVVLSFPDAWDAPISPWARTMEARARRWLSDEGVLIGEAGARKFDRLAVGHYANWPFPTADEEAAETITKFLALWIFYDDVIEEVDDGLGERVAQAVAGRPETRPMGEPYLACWWELGRACRRRMSEAWLDRHALRFSEWLWSVRDESTAAQVFRRSGVVPTAAAHLARRRLNIGMLPNVDFIEYQHGRELPEAVFQMPEVIAITHAACEMVAIVNDLFGWSKDQSAGWPNLVSSIQHDLGSSLEEAFERAVAMNDARIQTVTELESRALAKVDGDPLVRDWLRALRHVVHGFARWHQMAPRYRSVFDLGGARTLRIDVRTRSQPTAVCG